MYSFIIDELRLVHFGQLDINDMIYELHGADLSSLMHVMILLISYLIWHATSFVHVRSRWTSRLK